MLRAFQIIILIALANGATVVAQEPQATPDVAPPPMKAIPRQERSQLDLADSPKERVKLAIALAETHLMSAEGNSSRNDFAGASAALGRYWALLEDVFGFLKTMKPESNKARDLYKRLELTLRSHGPRLLALRRGTPAEYSVWIKEVEEFARNGRTEALNSFYGHTVLREPGPKTSVELQGAQPQKALNAAEVKKP